MKYRGEQDQEDCSAEEKAYTDLLAEAISQNTAQHDEDLRGKLDVWTGCIQTQCNAELGALCGAEPDMFTLIGHAGVSMMIFESGMHFDFDRAKSVGPKACVIAVFGTFLPIIA